MVKIIELRPNRKLLNSKFEKYQFCSDSIPIKNEKKLKNEIQHIELNALQDSWLEAKLFAFHNHLFKNPYDSTCWFIDKNGQIWKFQIDGSLNLIFKSKSINVQSSNYTYNPSIAFASKNIIVICNGCGAKEFLIENEGSVKSFLFEDIEPTVIFDARYIEESSKIIIGLYKIDEYQGKKFSRLIFLFYNYDKNSKDESQTIKLVQRQTLKVKGSVDYIYIEKSGNFAHIISQNQVEFDYDSVNPIKIEKNESNNSEIKIEKYYWSQDEDSLTIHIKIPDNYTHIIPKIETTPTSLSILVGDRVLLSGQTHSRLESELTTWKSKENALEVELTKSECGLMWSELIKGDISGEYLPNEALATEVHSRLSHLCSDQQESNIQDQPTIGFNSEQLEECDLSGAENMLQRICFNTHNITHLAMLGSSSRVLFVEKLPSGMSICLRYDHDGCFWLTEESDSEDWDFKHTHTFPGFGYIEASKTNKKFCTSPSDRSYIAIIEHTRHVFIYEKPDDNNAQIGKQRILDCGNEVTPILGTASINKYLILLTKNTLYQYLVYS